MKKKGQIGQLQSLIVPLVGIAILLVIGFLIFAEVRTNETVAGASGVCSTEAVDANYACNGTLEVIDALGDLPGWLPIIVIVVIGAILLSLVAAFRERQ